MTRAAILNVLVGASGTRSHIAPVGSAMRAWRRRAADYIGFKHWDRPTPVGDDSLWVFNSGPFDLAGSLNVVRL